MATTFWRQFFNFMAFIALTLIGLSLMLAKLIPSVSGAFSLIAQILAYIIIMFYSFIYVFRARNGWTTRRVVEFVIWVVASVLIIVFLILNTNFSNLID